MNHLSQEQELNLIKKYQEKNDAKSLHLLIESQMGLITKIAKSLCKQQQLNDAINEGVIGLIQAIKKFDITKNTKKIGLIIYSAHWIRSYIREYKIKNWRSIKTLTTTNQRCLYHNIGKIKNKLLNNNIEPSRENIAKELNINIKDVDDISILIEHRTTSLDVKLNNGITLEESLSNDDDLTEQIIQYDIVNKFNDIINELKQKLNNKELYILEKRLLNDEPMTLHDIGKHFGVSRERIRQIEIGVMNKLKIHTHELV